MRKIADATKNVDMRNFFPAKALGRAVSTLKNVDMRKSNPCKGMMTCRHFGGVRAITRASRPAAAYFVMQKLAPTFEGDQSGSKFPHSKGARRQAISPLG
jgi:hypothetical protein